MLNWIAYLDRAVPVRPRRAAPERRRRDVADLERRRRLGASCRCSGATRSCRALHIGFFIALAALVVFWLILNRTTLGYEVRAVGFNPEAARYGGINVAQEPTSSRWRSRARSPASPARWTCSAGSYRVAPRHPGLDDRLPRHRGRAARPEHRASASASRRCSSARCSSARRRAASTRASSSPSSPAT